MKGYFSRDTQPAPGRSPRPRSELRHRVGAQGHSASPVAPHPSLVFALDARRSTPCSNTTASLFGSDLANLSALPCLMNRRDIYRERAENLVARSAELATRPSSKIRGANCNAEQSDLLRVTSQNILRMTASRHQVRAQFPDTAFFLQRAERIE